MSTAQAIRVGGVAQPTRIRRMLDRHFYFAMSLVIAAVVVYGFSLTIDQRLFHPRVKPPLLLWIHGIVFFSWVGLFVLQSALVRIRKVKVHKLLGWYFAGLGAAIPVLGVFITRVMARFQITSLRQDPIARIEFMAIPLQDMVAFAIAFLLAVLWRKRPEYHRRLMLIATCALTAAAWGRTSLVEVPYISFYCGVDALIVLGVIRDLFVTRRVHQVYAWSLPLLASLQLGAIYLAEHGPQWWIRFGRAFIG